ncbi:MAG: UvrD-helicase domain-containing protein, partial [Oscillospiraceae bacterium]
MAENRWTDKQLEAIEARDTSVIVSAAAGSGKTSVLVERLLRIL